MSFSSTQTLQFDELLDLIASYAGSGAGRELIFALEPSGNRPQLEAISPKRAKPSHISREVVSPQQSGRGAAVRLRFDQIRDIEASVRLLRVEGASLDGPAILDLFHTLQLAGDYRGMLTGVADRYPRLARRGGPIGRFARISAPLSQSVSARWVSCG